MSTTPTTPSLRWDWGTGYDLFASLYALFHPSSFALRPAWAAGVRSRIPAPLRDVLAASLPFMGVPVHWILDQSQPKDARSILSCLSELAPETVLRKLTINPRSEDDGDSVLLRISETKRWTDDDRSRVIGCLKKRMEVKVHDDALDGWLGHWAEPTAFGVDFQEAVAAYYENFFREEEKRIIESLSKSVERGRRLAASMTISELLEDLSQGLEIESLLSDREIVLIPSFWTTPLILFGEYEPGISMVVYGARPKDASLVPGDVVPDSLSRALSALSDNTRLRILRLLREAPRTQIEIARALRLRAPTITHHLRTLRLAGLVRLTYASESEKRYSIRTPRVDETTQLLSQFIDGGTTSTAP